jgi:hypothetical protein
MSFDRPDDQSAYVAAGRLDQAVHRRRTLNMVGEIDMTGVGSNRAQIATNERANQRD